MEYYILLEQPRDSNYVRYIEAFPTLLEAQVQGNLDAATALDWPRSFWDGQMSASYFQEDSPGVGYWETFTIIRRR